MKKNTFSLSTTSFFTLLYRECYRFTRLSRQTIIPPLISTLLFIFVFGYSLGSQIKEINHFPYIIYILPGLAAMNILNHSYANTSTSLFMSRMDRSIENMIAAPLSPLQLVTALILGGLIRGMLIGCVSLLIGFFFVNLPIHHPFYTLTIVLLTSVLFSCLGIISSLWSDTWDQIGTFTNFIITPFIYLGGVFYSVHLLPPFWKTVTFFNPVFYLVDALRWSTLGSGDIPFFFSFLFLLVSSVLCFTTCVLLFKKGYKLVV